MDNHAKKATECFTYVKRTFVLTFLLVCVTIAVMYGSTQNISVQTARVLQSNYRPMAVIDRNVSITKQVDTAVNNSSNIVKNDNLKPSHSNQIVVEPNFDATSEIQQKVVSDTTLTETTSQVISESTSTDLTSTVRNLDTKVINHVLSPRYSQVTEHWPSTLPRLTGLVPLKPGDKESEEFPGMPDPCVAPRRYTGVEDVLCMKPPTFLPEYKNPCWYDEQGTFRCLPYFHLIGICKSGTSDFFKRLLKHPDIVPNRGIFGKEIWYWSWKRFFTKDKSGHLKPGMTLMEFTQQFQTSIIKTGTDASGYHNKVTGHGDPMDIWDRFREDNTPQNSPGAEELLWTTPYAVRHINPNVKLLLMFRDPIDRLYSHYFHGNYGPSARSFHDHVVQSIGKWKACVKSHTIRHCIYSESFKKSLQAPIHTSFYIVHLREWLKVFPRESIFIFRNEDYTKDIKGSISDICRYLNVSVPSDKVLSDMQAQEHFYATKGKQRAGPMMSQTKQLLIDLYKPYVDELARFLNDERFAFKDQSFG